MKKSLYFLFLILFCICVTAQESCIVNQNCTLWAVITNETDYYNVSNVNITIYYPNSLLYNESVPMNYVDIGIYEKIFIFNITGNWLGCAEFYNSTDIISISCESKYIMEEDPLTSDIFVGSIGILVALLGITLFFALVFWIYNKLDNKKHDLIKMSLFAIMSIMTCLILYLISDIFVLINLSYDIGNYGTYFKWLGTLILTVGPIYALVLYIRQKFVDENPLGDDK